MRIGIGLNVIILQSNKNSQYDMNPESVFIFRGLGFHDIIILKLIS